jgi:tetratricopeptide (TPR) repeat protein
MRMCLNRFQWFFSFFTVVTLISCGSSQQQDFSELHNQLPYKTFTDSIALAPKVAYYYFTRGNLLKQDQFFEAALQDFDKAYKLEKNAVTAEAYGLCLVSLNRLDSAETFFKEVEPKFSTDNVFLASYAYALGKKKKFEEELKLYERILSIDSNNYRVLGAKGFALQNLGQDSLAARFFQKSFQIFPNLVTGNEMAGYMANTKHPNTIAFCKQLLSLDTVNRSVKPLYFMGLYYENVGDNNKALEFYDLCIKEDYSFVDPYLNKSQLLVDTKKYDEALAIVNKGKQVEPQSPDLCYIKGQIFEAQGKNEDAVLEYSRAMALDKEGYAYLTEKINALKK